MIKNIVFLAFCILHFVANAQRVVKDTSYLEYSAGKFFNVQFIEYEDESNETFRRFLCDSSSVYRYFNSEVLAFSSATSNSVKDLNRINNEVGAMRSKLLYIASVSNISLLDSFMRDNADFLIDNSWEIVHNDSIKQIEFIKTQAGFGRYVVEGYSNRQFQIIGKDILWLINYAEGLDKGRVLRMYRVGQQRFESVGKTYVMRRVNGSGQTKRVTSNPSVFPIIEDDKPSQKQKRNKKQ